MQGPDGGEFIGARVVVGEKEVMEESTVIPNVKGGEN